MESTLLDILDALRAGGTLSPDDVAQTVRAHNAGVRDQSRQVSKKKLLRFYFDTKRERPDQWARWQVTDELEARRRLVRELVGQVRPGGSVALSAWRFRRSDELAGKADAVRAQALAELGLSEDDLEPGDHFLDWQGTPGVYRFCHHASDEELDALVAAVADEARLVARYDADGRTGDLNTYLVFEARG